ncbi:MAG: flagellar export protein FliJ [Plesiomonas sp.]|uniref:flagellar export protein FliJ n=1 Tax=Plesiomonas sp. TaxID=2486279 RepID=UPI003F3C9FA8
MNALTLLLEQAEQKEQTASGVLSQARQQLSGHLAQMDVIHDYRFDYCQQLSVRGSAGLTAHEYSHLQQFIGHLDQNLTKQNYARRSFEEQADRARDQWLTAKKKHKSLMMLIEKRTLQKQQKAAREEQKLNDEMAEQLLRRKATTR